MATHVSEASGAVQKAVPTSTAETLDQVEHKLALFRAKLEAVQPLVTAIQGRYAMIQDTITALEERVALHRQGQLNLEVSDGDA